MQSELNLATCPECGSGDVGFDTLSVRPYCSECNYWPQPNWGSRTDAITRWNADPRRDAELEAGR